MALQPQIRFRFIPPKINAALMTLLFLAFPLVFGVVMLGSNEDTVVTVNGMIVTGDERERTLTEMNAIFFKMAIPMILIALWSARRILPRSPFDYFEVGPDGLLIHGIFGSRRFAWTEIADISIRVVPASRIPFAWMTVRSATRGVSRFYFNGYIRIRLFSDLGVQAGEISDWFSQLRSAYTKGNMTGSLPPTPWGLIGKMIEFDSPIAPAPLPSAVERHEA